MVGNPADAEDLLQEIFLSAHRKLDSFRGESALGTWLYRLATNLCLDHLRSRAARTSQLTDALDDEPGLADASSRRLAERALSRMDLERALAQLPEGCRAAFVLHDVEGLEHREVAEALGIAEGTSKSQVHKARLRLRSVVEAMNGARTIRHSDPGAGRRHAGTDPPRRTGNPPRRVRGVPAAGRRSRAHPRSRRLPGTAGAARPSLAADCRTPAPGRTHRVDRRRCGDVAAVCAACASPRRCCSSSAPRSTCCIRANGSAPAGARTRATSPADAVQGVEDGVPAGRAALPERHREAPGSRQER